MEHSPKPTSYPRDSEYGAEEVLPTHHVTEQKSYENFDDKKKDDTYETSTSINMHSPVDEEKMDEFEAAERRAAENDEKNMGPSKIGVYYQKYLFWCHLVMWLLFTGFLIAAYVLQVPKGYNQENLILGLIYAWFTIYIFFSHVPKTIVTKPWMFCVRLVAKPIYMIPELYRKIAYGLFVLAVIVVTVFSMPERPESNRVQRIIALFGMVIFLGGVFLCSKHHRAVNWNTVSSAILIQFLLALFVFRSKPGHDIFNWASKFAQGYLGKSSAGSSFVFGDAAVASGVFAMNVFPTIIFFAATVQCLYYMGALQWLLKKCAVVFKSVLNVSGAEAVVAVASPFLGQGENALLIKPFMPYLTTSEMHQVMTSGFATISGSVLYGYIAMGVPGDALLTSCVMSIPCSLAISKLRMPEVDEPLTSKEVRIPPSDEKHANILHAAGGGAAIGINIVLLMIANLVSLLALLEAVNAGLTWVGNFITIHELTLQLITGYIFVPVAWLIGVDNQDLVKVGQLLAWKIWANEFVAYQRMVDLWEAGELTARSHLVTIYALCGFANLGSVGMQIGILSSMAPKRSGEISRLAVSSMLCGAVSTWVSASIAGMLL